MDTAAKRGVGQLQPRPALLARLLGTGDKPGCGHRLGINVVPLGGRDSRAVKGWGVRLRLPTPGSHHFSGWAENSELQLVLMSRDYLLNPRVL